MKKYIIKTLLLSLLIFTVSCNEEYADHNPPSDINDTSWVIGFNQNLSAEDAYSINIGTHMTFLDLSQGFEDHRWIIEEGNNFLKGRFTRNDSLPLFVKNNDTITSDLTAHVLFSKPGLNTVRLYNTYTKPVSRRTSNGIFRSRQEGNLHVIDTTFTFDVYDSIKPAFRILQDGNIVCEVPFDSVPSLDNKDSWPVVEVKAATGLTYLDLSETDGKGRPNSRRWTIADGSPTTSSGSEALIKFFRLGTFEAGTILSNRLNLGRSFPPASTERIIPLMVKVVQSDLPFEINGRVNETEDEILRFQVTGEIEPFSGQEAFFTVNVKNDNGFDQNISVLQAKKSESNGTFIELKLSEPIYNSDQITVNYAGGVIKSTDERLLNDFAAPVPVNVHFDSNIMPGNGWASFEVENGAINRAFAQDYFTGNGNKVDGSNTVGYYMRNTDKSFLGEASMRFQSTDANPLPNVNLWGFAFAKPNAIPAGTYKVSYRIFLEAGNTLKTIRTEINKPVFAFHFWDIENTPRGSWQLIEQEITFTQDITETNTRWTFRVHPQLNVGVTGAQTMYIDDFSLIEVEVRP